MERVLFGLLLLGLASGYVLIPATHPSIKYDGRKAVKSDGAVGFDWSGFSFSTRVCGATIVRLGLQDIQGIYSIYIDDIKTQTLHVNPASIADITIPSIYCHTLRVTKISEASNNPNGVSLLNSIITNAPSFNAHLGEEEGSQGERGREERRARHTFTRRLEFIGDGITCGYGVLAESPSCPPRSGFYGNEDVTHTYAGYISRSFQAQSQVECYTGKGVVHNKDDLNVLSSNPMPKYWNRTFATISTVPYNFQSFSPDAVYINLGTNDFASQPSPSSSQFMDGYKSFIAKIREQYNVPIFLACGPMASSETCSYVEQVAKDESQTTYIFLNSSILDFYKVGCDGFPNFRAQKIMADKSIPIMSQVLGW